MIGLIVCRADVSFICQMAMHMASLSCAEDSFISQTAMQMASLSCAEAAGRKATSFSCETLLAAEQAQHCPPRHFVQVIACFYLHHQAAIHQKTGETINNFWKPPASPLSSHPSYRSTLSCEFGACQVQTHQWSITCLKDEVSIQMRRITPQMWLTLTAGLRPGERNPCWSSATRP